MTFGGACNADLSFHESPAAIPCRNDHSIRFAPCSADLSFPHVNGRAVSVESGEAILVSHAHQLAIPAGPKAHRKA